MFEGPGKMFASAFVTGAIVLGAAGAAGTPVGSAVATAVYHPRISVLSGATSFKTSQSSNWSGYNQGFLSTDTPFQSITGQWTVPTATQHTPGQAESSATWIGIGGGCIDAGCTLTDATLIQTGTEQDVDASGQTSYSAWWEIVPVPSITASIAVHPGDTISASISQLVPELWTISLSDVTDGQSFTQTIPYVSTYLTAEWINEAPVVIGTRSAGEASLPNLTPVHFDLATVNGSNAQLSSSQEIQMSSSSGQVLATPSSPDPDADGFADCAYATSCAAPASS